MPSLLNSELVGAASLVSSTDAILGELSRQLASVHGRRHSKESNGHRTPGSAMRVAKPSSASNSPQSNILKTRRRTMMNDNFQGRLHLPRPVEASYLPTPSADAYDPTNEPAKRAVRPLSWHPSPQHLAHPPQHQSLMHYPFPSYQEAELYTNFQQLPPTPAAYSAYNSPASATAFSPLSLPYSNLEYQSYVSPTTWTASAAPIQASQSTASSSLGSAECHSVVPQQLPRFSGSSGSSSDWGSFAERDFDRCTAPPTPENFEQPSQTQTKLRAEDSIPFRSLDEDDSDGEILYGMGLYDAPENSQLEYHRSTVMSLLGSANLGAEPTGKGLKLEDAWEPPVLDDDDDE